MLNAFAVFTSIIVVLAGAAQSGEQPAAPARLAHEPASGPLILDIASPPMVNRGFRIDGSRRVPASTHSVADLDRTRDAVGVIVEALDLRWKIESEVYGLPSGGDALTARPVRLRMESVSLTLLPSPQDIVMALADAKASSPEGTVWAPDSIRPKNVPLPSSRCVYLARKLDRQATDYRTPRPQGTPAKAIPITLGMGDPLTASGRLIDQLGIIAADMNHAYDSVIGAASVAKASRNIWYYRIEVANPHKGPRRGSALGVLDDATVVSDWCFPIMDANGQARGNDDPRRAERGYPYENLATTTLIDFPIKGQQTPLVLPTAWSSEGPRSSPQYEQSKMQYDGTETIVLPQRLIDAAGGVVIVRKAASWRPLAQDIVIDADTKNPAGTLGVYVSQVVTNDRLIDALAELCGKTPPTGAARAALLETVSKTRTRE